MEKKIANLLKTIIRNEVKAKSNALKKWLTRSFLMKTQMAALTNDN